MHTAAPARAKRLRQEQIEKAEAEAARLGI
jgi:hypothetical protein